MIDIPRLMDWKIEQDNHGIVWLYFDKAEATANTLGDNALAELDKIITYFEHHPPTGIVLASSKKSGFIAGADIERISQLNTPAEAVAFVSNGQKLVDRFEKLACPKVAMIQGFCLGGGLELSLACDYLIAEDRPDTRIGLPEVLLGIQPGWGGTVRLPRRIGVPKALELIVTGQALRGKQALRAGIIDYLLPLRVIKRAASQLILTKPPKKRAPVWNEVFRLKPMRQLLGRFMKHQIGKRAKPEFYPAPYEVITNWEKFGTFNDQGYQAEIDSIEKIAMHETAKNLIRIFFLQEHAKEQGKVSNFKAKHVHVIGAGIMGGDIAAWCAMQGLKVTLQDQSAERIAPAIKRAADALKKRLKDPRLVRKYMDLLIPDVAGKGVSQADVIIEAVFENLQVKQEIFKKVEAEAKEGAILATNTSSIPLDEINTVLSRPSRLVGIHFFNPVAKMQLVEVVAGKKTDKRIYSDALAFVLQIKKLPLSVNSAPGFLVNRVLTPYLLEAVQLITEGVKPEDIDKAAVAFGMPMGPIELADVVGLDICVSVADHLKECFEVNIPPTLAQKVKDGHLGKKTGQGFYKWIKGKPLKNPPSDKGQGLSPEIIQNRLIMRLVNESMACLREGIVATADEVDTGIIFGTGFAPFRGGPLNYAKSLSFGQVSNQLDHYAQEYGDRFAPDLGWKEMAKND
jgi:3-hydroxyacyl-CoA dehydrogenase / enoyl-CoA hydratase / 3-hydroxybutyryl-CoA epimerase